jgi:protein SCO1/2
MKTKQWLFKASAICLVALGDAQSVAVEFANEPGTNVRTFAVSGTIKELRPDGKTAVIQHEAISNYMEAMTMPFHARTTNDLASVRSGDLVTFRLSVTDSESWIDEVRKTGRTNAPIVVSVPGTVAEQPAETINVVEGLSTHTFTNEFGQAINFRQFKGQAIGLTFFFTRCPIPEFCPRLAKNFAAATRKLESLPNGPTNWHFFSISFDTQADSPAVLRNYASAYGYDSNRWTFLTASQATINTVTRNFGFKFEPQDGLFTHNFLTVVLDARGFWQAGWPIGGDTSDNLVQEIIKAASPDNR